MQKKLQEKMNGYIANCALLYIKLHNLHWNVVGSQFKAVHEYLEELYTEISSNYDEVAELMKIHNVMPLGSYMKYASIASISELDDIAYDTLKTLEIVRDDFLSLKHSLKDILSLAEKESLVDISSTFEELIKKTNKHLWFIESSLK